MTGLGVRLQPMTWDEYDAWSVRSRQGFAAQQVASGVATEADATSYAEKAFDDLLPSGIATPLHTLATVRPLDADDVVGHLWMRVRPVPDEVEAYLFDVDVVAAQRGRGWGRAAMLAAQAAARDLGATVMRLTVFGHNDAALRLYDGLGYAVIDTAFVGAGPDRVVGARLMALPLTTSTGEVPEMGVGDR